ncbi:MAG: GatB/YqeY domain-containing protein [Chloroflexota bacterium]
MEVNLRERLTSDLRQSLRSGDKLRCSTIRLLLAAIKNTEIARLATHLKEEAEKPGAKGEKGSWQATLDDSGILGVIAKEIKQRQESIEAFKKGNRPDLVAKEEAEMAILNAYLPKQASRDEITALARKIIEEVGAKGPGDKGKVMPKIIAELRGKADGREINAVVTELLAAQK